MRPPRPPRPPCLSRRVVLALALLFAACLLPRVGSTQAPASGDDEVLAVVRRLFDGMRSADSAMVRSTMVTGVRFAGVETRSGAAAITFDSVDNWVRAIANSNKRWNEQTYDVRLHVDGNLAVVWAGYTFYLDGKLSHCGTDALDLLKDASGWKITQLADTRRRENCRDVLQ